MPSDTEEGALNSTWGSGEIHEKSKGGRMGLPQMSLQSWGTYRMGGGLAVGQVEGVRRVWRSAADLEGKGIKSYQDTLNQQAKLGLWADHSAERNLEV